MDCSSEQELWTATQVRTVAATGLASSHLQPFTRILYNDPKTRMKGGRSRSMLVESRDHDEVICHRQREQNGKYTAFWTSPSHLRSNSGEVFNVHSVVDWIELQLWNRFDNGFDVFLGKASVSLHQLHQQCSEAVETNGTTQNVTTTHALWYPLRNSEVNGLAHLSLQVECVFTSDPKVLHIREAIQQRRKRKAKNEKRSGDGSGVDQQEASEDVDASIVDPAFAFTQPFLPVEWSLVASTSIRHLFFHSDIEPLANFRETILFSDLERELDEDEELQIHDDHLTAFKTCQFSAQYLDHCVKNLSQRLQDYSEDYHALAHTRKQLAKKNKALKAQRSRLQKEHDDLDLLIKTYQSVLDKNGCNTLSSSQLQQPSSPIRGDLSPQSPPVSPTASLSSKKPVFLKTWEERERERRLEKEISKAQRIEDEKQRIIQHILDRQQRDDYAALISKFAENRKQRAARHIQTFFRNIKFFLHAQRCVAEYRAATLVQTAWRRFVLMRQYPHRLKARKQENEILLMAQNERELRQWLAGMEQKQREEAMARAMSPPESIQSDEAEDCNEGTSPSTSPSKQVVDTLVSTWRKLHRVFVLAHRAKGIDYNTLFSEIDLRKDDVIDRAELRLGARSFGVRLDRKITRALITLIRTKCGAPSKPLLVTFEQFLTGFELTSHLVKSADTNLLRDDILEHSADDSRKKINANDTADETLANGSPGTRDNKTIDEEALIMTVRALRAAVYEAATAFLGTMGKPSNDYRAFRDALATIFSEFDTDKNGELDVDELVACMASFNLRLSNEKISLVRELFVGDYESDKIGVVEFISFVLAHSSSFGEDELGLLGRRIREQIMNCVQQAQAQTESIEDAVRLVFAAAYKREDQKDCSIRDFVRVLNRLHLGITPSQVARLVVRLDRNGDRSISFEELLIWLRIRSKTSHDDNLVASFGRATALQLATEKAKALRLLLENLATNLTSPITHESKKANLISLFRQIDLNNSGKISQEELQLFLGKQNLLSFVGTEVLIQLCGVSILPQNPVALVAQEMMTLLDLNANGVTTLKEWLTFAQFENEKDGTDPVVVESIRKALTESENNDPERLMMWFTGLSGSISAATTRQGERAQMKIRVAEFKTALRAKLGGAHSISIKIINRVVESLDKDSSGWITTSELSAWAFPPRDLEELLRLVINSWQIEFQQFTGADFAANLYQRFDVDDNGSLAVQELLQGFLLFGLTLSEYESQVLLITFDLDRDGCWSKPEFFAFVSQLFPTESLIEEPSTSNFPQHTEETLNSPTVQASSNDSGEGSNAYGDSAFSDNDQLLESGSSNGLSSPSYSDKKKVVVRPVEYSEDFDETSV